MKSKPDRADPIPDSSDLYEHLVNDHGWERRPYLINHRLHDLHRLEHTEADLGLLSVGHSHDTKPAPVIALPWATGESAAADPPHAA